MLDQRYRHWANIETTLAQHLVFAGITLVSDFTVRQHRNQPMHLIGYLLQ